MEITLTDTEAFENTVKSLSSPEMGKELLRQCLTAALGRLDEDTPPKQKGMTIPINPKSKVRWGASNYPVIDEISDKVPSIIAIFHKDEDFVHVFYSSLPKRTIGIVEAEIRGVVKNPTSLKLLAELPTTNMDDLTWRVIAQTEGTMSRGIEKLKDFWRAKLEEEGWNSRRKPLSGAHVQPKEKEKMVVFGVKIREARNNLGLQQSYVASLVGMKQGAYSRIERGISLTTKEQRIKIQETLKIEN